jgi:glycosyltransferase involved in cell wall biosynthesis
MAKRKRRFTRIFKDYLIYSLNKPKMDNLKTGRNLIRRILLVTRPIAPPWDEASKNFAYTLAKNFPDFEFGLLTNGLIPNLPENIRQEPIYTSNNFNAWQKLKLLKYLSNLKKNDFNVLHFLFTPTKLNSFLLRNLLGGKKIATVQTIATLREDLYTDKEIKKMAFADEVVAYSKYAEEKLKKLGINDVHQIYPGVDLELYKPTMKDTELLTAYCLPQNDFIVTFPGEFVRLGATDDIVNLILRYSSILYEKNIKIIFACRVKNKKDFKKRGEIKRKLKEKGLADLARFPDTFTTLEKLFNTSDLVIFPVRDMKGKFDVPLVVIEAMACAKPVVISDLPILREFSSNENSVIIKSGDIKQLLEAILGLRQNKEKRESVGRKARIFAQDYFNIKKIAEQYKNIYNSL